MGGVLFSLIHAVLAYNWLRIKMLRSCNKPVRCWHNELYYMLLVSRSTAIPQTETLKDIALPILSQIPILGGIFQQGYFDLLCLYNRDCCYSYS